MALISLLLSFIGKKIGTLIQAIFGWSVTALFGRLAGKKQLVITIALVLSIAWPVFVVGLFFPSVAGWLLAILPLEQWVGALPLRVVWAALALISPPIVGLLVHWAAPVAKGSALRSAIAGFPLAIGFFISFFVTAISVPIVKIISVLRGWSDTHIYVQPRAGRYVAVVRELAEACARAGLMPEIAPPPKRMMIATNVLRVLAKAAVSPIVAEEILTVRADGLQMILYPADLLLRGKPSHVARIRAMMTRTDIDADAYLVGSERGQEIQDELGRMLDVVRRHEERHTSVGSMATRRLVEIWREMNNSELPFEDWVMLESIARRVERRIVGSGGADHKNGTSLLMPLDNVEDGLEKIAAKANANALRSPSSSRGSPTADSLLQQQH